MQNAPLDLFPHVDTQRFWRDLRVGDMLQDLPLLMPSQSLQISPTPGITASTPDASPSSPLYQLTTSSGTHGAPTFNPQLAPRTQRSQSMVGHPPVTANFIPMQRQHTYSHAAPTSRPMVRTTSTLSDRGNIPFTTVGPIAPMLPINGNGMVDPLIGPHEVSMPTAPAMSNPRQRRRSELSTLHENMLPDVGEDVDTFLARHGTYQDPFALTSPSMPLFPYDTLTPSTCPSMVSGPSAAEDGAMSRVNSSFDSIAMSRSNSAFTSLSMGGSFDMSRLDSTRSQYLYPRSVPSPKGLSMDELFAGVGASLPSSSDAMIHSPSFQIPNMQSLPMQPSISCASTKSTLGLEKRAKEATHRHIMNSMTEILPKPIETVPCPLVRSRVAVSPQHIHMPSHTRPQTISKASSTKRLKTRKIMCSECDEQPEGFRGEHELRRHIASKHTAQAKRWVCRDPRDVGIETTLKPIKPLNKCKYCLEGKQYNIDYNAAAHLRRIHFNPKTARAKNKNGAKRGAAAIAEKRGGKGGGDQPVIEDLRHWLMEITVDIQPREGSDETGDQDMEEAEEMMDIAFDDVAPAVGVPAFGLDQTTMCNPDMTQMPLEQFPSFEAGPFPTEVNIFADVDFGNYGLPNSMSDSVATITPNMFVGFSH